MTTYYVTIDDEEFQITVQKDGTLLIERDSEEGPLPIKTLSANLDKFSGHRYIFRQGSESLPVSILEQGPHDLALLFRGRPMMKCKVHDEQSRALIGEVKRQGDLFVKSPMPGIVLAVHVEVGQIVSEGDILLVLEAMKTENEIRATLGARVKTVHVTSGETIANDALLIELEEIAEQALEA